MRQLTSIVPVQSVRRHGALRASSRNAHSASGWEVVLKTVVARYRGQISNIYFRGDAEFVSPEIYNYLEAGRIKFAIVLPANRVLQGRIGHELTRPVGRPPNAVRRSYANFSCQAASWT